MTHTIPVIDIGDYLTGRPGVLRATAPQVHDSVSLSGDACSTFRRERVVPEGGADRISPSRPCTRSSLFPRRAISEPLQSPRLVLVGHNMGLCGIGCWHREPSKKVANALKIEAAVYSLNATVMCSRYAGRS